MLRFVIRRTLVAIPTLIAVSIFTFIIIQLPPGDYLSSYVLSLRAQGDTVDEAEIEFLTERYGLGKPIYAQYWLWISGIFRGDFGESFEWRLPVSQLIGQRLLLTFVVSLSTMLFTWTLAFPIRIFSATH